ncbi:alpha/beta hydrolase [Tardiphaga sp. vice352]|uniref:alpha/beta fold hydrolase n=1 Tax=unclassified Tardiphaga TaxID=2631404 RepID=UPI001164EC04|nr:MULTISPECIES: alpha/beta hydrolase [unclassified Tardiphaga]QDM18633.1 alpha/beta hydrolase [Tardiphaga sp. vice278]QDM23629.1 alpha/beta hydrolase [Tardiphaga sp. vice154]QDM28854.1 alpha/beta hydrolase [Tardiphaga sp. vice304]QDM33953.1 alpha/beta hydrolase [Tardiphaga sp. vice352]
MITLTVVATLAVLALVTQAGVYFFERKYPAQGRFVDVAGGRLHAVEIGPQDAKGPPIVLIHGATSSLETMRLPLGNRLAKDHRVILIDRPGFGWSTRDELSNSSPAMQARMIDEALGKIGVDRAIVVVHSLAGALGALLALDHPHRIEGLVMLAGVTYPWPGGVGTYNEVVTTKVIGPLLASTITLPLGYFMTDIGGRAVFAPQIMPANYIENTATPLVLRPRNFLANAWDLVRLKPAVAEQAPRYRDIRVPTVIIAGSADTIVSTDIHSRRFAAAVPGAKLIVLPNVGHMVQDAAPDLICREIESMISAADIKPKAATR